MRALNRALHFTASPLRLIAAGQLFRSTARLYHRIAGEGHPLAPLYAGKPGVVGG